MDRFQQRMAWERPVKIERDPIDSYKLQRDKELCKAMFTHLVQFDEKVFLVIVTDASKQRIEKTLADKPVDLKAALLEQGFSIGEMSYFDEDNTINGR